LFYLNTNRYICNVMRNPELTKVTILEESGKLFNVKGYKATSLSEITKKTGLTKGAIYSHFGSKAGLEKETLIYLTQGMLTQLRVKIKAANNAPDKIRAILNFYRSYTTNPPVHGGCPLLNAAVEADDANPELRKVVKGILEVIHQSAVLILNNGIKFKQIKPSTDTAHFATVIFASLEGAIMMTKITNNKIYINNVIDHLEQKLETYTV